jgi:hypothetical protein
MPRFVPDKVLQGHSQSLVAEFLGLLRPFRVTGCVKNRMIAGGMIGKRTSV